MWGLLCSHGPCWGSASGVSSEECVRKATSTVGLVNQKQRLRRTTEKTPKKSGLCAAVRPRGGILWQNGHFFLETSCRPLDPHLDHILHCMLQSGHYVPATVWLTSGQPLHFRAARAMWRIMRDPPSATLQDVWGLFFDDRRVASARPSRTGDPFMLSFDDAAEEARSARLSGTRYGPQQCDLSDYSSSEDEARTAKRQRRDARYGRYFQDLTPAENARSACDRQTEAGDEAEEQSTGSASESEGEDISYIIGRYLVR